MMQEDYWHARIEAEFPICERHSANVNPAGRYIFPLYITHLSLLDVDGNIVPASCNAVVELWPPLSHLDDDLAL
jgi:hypothetical protein